MKWKLIKKKFRILSFSESFQNFNRNNSYFKEITDDTFKKLASMKLRNENEIQLRDYILDDNKKMEISNLLNLNISTNYEDNIKINYLNKKKKEIL